MDARDITGRRDDAALAAADDDGLVGKLGIVPFLDLCIERVAIDMGKAKCEEFRMAQHPRAAAGTAPARLVLLLGQAVSAETGQARCVAGHGSEQRLNISTLMPKLSSLKAGMRAGGPD